jgi:hypothetical protein
MGSGPRRAPAALVALVAAICADGVPPRSSSGHAPLPAFRRQQRAAVPLQSLGLRGGGCCGAALTGEAQDVQQMARMADPAAAALAVPEALYMNDEQARAELAEAGVDVEAELPGPPEDDGGAGDMEDLARDLDDAHLDVEQPADPTPAGPDGHGGKKGLLTSTPLELKQHHPEVYEMMAEMLGEIPSAPAPRATHGADSYALSDAIAQAQQHRREVEAVTRQDREFGEFVATPSCAAQLRLFGLAPDDEAAEVVRQLAAPDVIVPRDASSVGEGVGMLEPGQMLVIAAPQRWHGQLDVAGCGINIAADAVRLLGSWALLPSSQGTLTSVSAINHALAASTDAAPPEAAEAVGAAGGGGCSTGSTGSTSSTVLALGGPWEFRACEVLSAGGRAALLAAQEAVVSLSGCVVGGCAAARPSLLAQEAGWSREDAEMKGADKGHGEAVGRGPMMGVSLLGHAECCMVECSLLFADASLPRWAQCGPVRSGAVGLPSPRSLPRSPLRACLRLPWPACSCGRMRSSLHRQREGTHHVV